MLFCKFAITFCTQFYFVIFCVVILYSYINFSYTLIIQVLLILEICESCITDCTSYKEYLQNLLDPDNEADMATVMGLRILTQVYLCNTKSITTISIPQYVIS